MQDIKKVHLPLFIANFFYGINFSIAKIALPQFITPFAFILIRVSVAGALFYLIHRLFINEKTEAKDQKKLFVCALFGVAINQLMFFTGLSLTTPIHAALIMIMTPVLVLLLARLINKEKITTIKATGITIAMAGAFFLMVFGKDLSHNSNTLLGDICIFINASSYAIYLVLVKPLTQKYHPVTVAKTIFLMATPIVMLTGCYEFYQIEWHTFTPKVWGAVASVVIGATFLAYLLNSVALRYTTPSVVGAYIYIQPIIATLLSYFMFNEPLTAIKIGSGVAICTGVFLVTSGQHLFNNYDK
jgi:drug/metabolite transporter (DMT)-like permease